MGITTYEMLCGKTPYYACRKSELKEEQRKPIIFDDVLNIPKDAQEFVHAMLQYDPNDRAEYEALLNFKFLQDKQEEIVLIQDLDESEYDFLDDCYSDSEEKNDYNKITEKKVCIEEEHFIKRNFKKNNKEDKKKEATEKKKKIEEEKKAIKKKIKEEKIEKKKKIEEQKKEAKAKKKNIEEKKNQLPEKKNEIGLKDSSVDMLIIEEEIKNSAVQIEDKTKFLNACLALKQEYDQNYELLYCLTLYAKRNFEELLAQITELSQKYPKNLLLVHSLSKHYITIQDNIIQLSSDLLTLKDAIPQASESSENYYLQQCLIDEAFTALCNKYEKEIITNAFYILTAGYFLYPLNEIIIEALEDCKNQKENL